jgi:hypothetical protein
MLVDLLPTPVSPIPAYAPTLGSCLKSKARCGKSSLVQQIERGTNDGIAAQARGDRL